MSFSANATLYSQPKSLVELFEKMLSNETIYNRIDAIRKLKQLFPDNLERLFSMVWMKFDEILTDRVPTFLPHQKKYDKCKGVGELAALFPVHSNEIFNRVKANFADFVIPENNIGIQTCIEYITLGFRDKTAEIAGCCNAIGINKTTEELQALVQEEMRTEEIIRKHHEEEQRKHDERQKTNESESFRLDNIRYM